MQELATTWPVGSPAMRVLVMLPTYNEIENIDDVLERARAALPDADVLVIDDGSPDGTAERAEKLGDELGGIDVLRRAAKSGLGSAYRAGFRVGLAAGLRRHDRDGRRPVARPRRAPRAGRRGRAGRRPRDRLALRARRLDPRLEVGAGARSRVAAASTPAPMLGLLGARRHRRLPGVPPRDCSRRSTSTHVRADGYGFQVEMTYLTERAGGRIVEVPIEFRDRTPRPLEDVEPHRGRGARSWSPGGASATGIAGRRRSSRPARATLSGMALAEFTVAGALVESPDGLLLVRNQRRNGAHRLEHARRRDRRHRRHRCSPASPARSRRRPACASPRGKARSTRCGPPRSRWAGRCGARCTARSRSRATSRVDDPDGIVVEAAFAAADACGDLLASCAPWVREPLADWLEHRWGPAASARAYTYDVFGTSRDDAPGRAHVDRRDARDGPSPSILHVDLDAFYASVEQLDDPSLVGQPGDRRRPRRRAASSPPRATRRARFGVLLGDADGAGAPRVPRRRVPRAALRRSTATQSRAVMAILRSFTPLVEPIALDEAFLDVARRAPHRTAPGPRSRSAIRGRVRAETGLTASVGVATTKLLAKLASDLAKPDGLLVVEPGTELEFLHPLAGRAPLGRRARDASAGSPRSASRPSASSRRSPRTRSSRTLGNAHGHHLHALAWNRDERPVEPGAGGEVDRPRGDVPGRPARPRARSSTSSSGSPTAWRRGCGPRRPPGGTVQLKVRFGDFRTITRSRTLREPTDLAADIAGWPASCSRASSTSTTASACSGVSVQQLVRLAPEPATRAELFGDDADAVGPGAPDRRTGRRQAALERSVDAVRARFGPGAVGPGQANSLPGEGPGRPTR